MRIFLITFSFPYPLAAEDSFLNNELFGYLEWRKDKSDIELILVPGNRDFRSATKQNDSIVLDESLLKIRNKIRRTRRVRILILFAKNIKFFFQERSAQFNTSLKLDIQKYLKWCDEKIVVDKALKSGWLKDLETDDVIYTWWLSGYTHALVSSKKLKKKNALIVSRAHGGDLFRVRGVQVRQIETVNLCRKVFPSTFRGLEDLVKRGAIENILERRVLGVQINKSELEPKQYKKYAFELLSNEIQIITVSGIDPVKDLGRLAKYLNEISRTGRKVKWHHFGESVEALINASLTGFKDDNLSTVSFGQLSNTEIHKILRTYSTQSNAIMVNFSISEGSALSLVEAVSNGVPVIGRDVGGVGEIVNEQTGVLLPEIPTIVDLHNAIEEILIKRNQLVSSCLEFYRDNYEAQKIYGEFYDSLCKLN